MKNFFSSDDVNYIRENYKNKTASEIARVLKRSDASIEAKAFTLKLKKGYKRKYSVNEDFFNDPKTLNSYWAGFIAADGCLRGPNLYHLSVCLSTKDLCHIKLFKEDLKYSGPVYFGSIIKKNNPKFKKEIYYSCGITVCSKKIYQSLLNYNIIPKKSLVLLPPKLNLLNSLSFIKGLIDGDGSIGISSNRLYLNLDGTKEICEWVSNIFDQLFPPKYEKFHAKPRQKNRNKNKNHYLYKVTGFRAKKILSLLLMIKTPELLRKWSNVNLSKEILSGEEIENINNLYKFITS